MCDIPQSSVARIESCKTTPNLGTLLNIFQHLGLTLTVSQARPMAWCFWLLQKFTLAQVKSIIFRPAPHDPGNADTASSISLINYHFCRIFFLFYLYTKFTLSAAAHLPADHEFIIILEFVYSLFPGPGPINLHYDTHCEWRQAQWAGLWKGRQKFSEETQKTWR